VRESRKPFRQPGRCQISPLLREAGVDPHVGCQNGASRPGGICTRRSAYFRLSATS
jgi:hypothetical protein